MRTRFEPQRPMIRSRLAMFALAATALLLTGSTAAQAQAISGKVTDAETGAPLAGARISASNGAQSAIARADGTYRLPISAGSQAIRVSFIGYTPVRDTVVITAAGAT